jgi:hypothetical protein
MVKAGYLEAREVTLTAKVQADAGAGGDLGFGH